MILSEMNGFDGAERHPDNAVDSSHSGWILPEMRFEMRPQIAVLLILIVAMGSFGSGCRSNTATDPATTNGSAAGAPAQAAFAGRFSGPRAWKHLEALAAIGPRSVGTPGAAKAREYITSELAALGLEAKPVLAELRFGSEEAPTVLELVNLTTTIPGNSSDLILLIAPYDSAYHENFRFVGVNDGASGAAVLLELARVLVAKPLPYTTSFYFLDGEAPLARGTQDDPASALLGSRLTARLVEQGGGSSSLRLLLHLNRVSDADLRIARDRFSHRIYRDAFWKAAARLGHREVFPVDTGFEAPASGHRAFFDLGMRRVVTIEDTGFGDGETELARYTEDDTLDRSSEESLAIVGQVVLSGLRDISASLEKIDQFSEAPTIPARDVPVNERRESAPPPEADAAPAEPPPVPEAPEAAEPPSEVPAT
ncbi:MAG: M28 family peptidase [Deltaproteobacteria bacterium]|nr:M28 family peptidase [Deltaproteobacteria bacterium]MBW2400530.1 M28 family peptidase [Deltaproteobacteria bacterium]